ncbi:vacuole membrane protein 1-like [Anoplophora glabripennis]|uniref:vacuole membrane protein 1-like n=2 Tax=Anoplophora glabripennis TaxID=217634 RepID=UPI000C75826D|nr:vacuole membrane protein 1-like [Anoplophora glabripennis]
MSGRKTRKSSVNKQNIKNVSSLASSSSNNISNSASRSKSVDELLSLTKEQLKNECRQRGLKMSGTKTELVQRLDNKMTSGARKDGAPTINGSNLQNNIRTKNHAEQQKREKERQDRESLVLWKRPIVTVEYFIREVIILLSTYGKKILTNQKLVSLGLISVLSVYILMNSKGPHQNLVQGMYKKLLWCLYWIGLGKIVCPNERDPLSITILSIMSKVRLEAMCWGAGTALGELPPYFMARAARLSGIDPDDDDDLKELEELERKKNNHGELTLIERGKILVEEVVQKVGFFGILACASIPNPLFDLAGITCGHFLVPFWTFFGATLIGKAIIKMHIQKLFVIIAFNESLIETAIEWLKVVPIIGERLQVPFKAFLDGQKLKLHKKSVGKVQEAGGNILGSIFEKFVIGMILYFIISIINSFAQSYHKRLHKKPAKINKD